MYYRHEVIGESWPEDDKLRGRIPVEKCKTRRLYRVDTRNFGPVAVFDVESNNGFYGLRRKFGIRLDVEYHFQNEAFNTASPWQELPEELPPEIELAYDLGSACCVCKKPVEFRPDDGVPGHTPGKWFHKDPSIVEDHSPEHRRGSVAVPGRADPVGVWNTPLFEWLKQMEIKYWHPAGEEPEWMREASEDEGEDPSHEP